MKYKRQISILFLTIVVSLGLVGCATVKGKFTRHKKKGKETPIFYLEKQYEGPTYAETYRRNYTFWKAWTGELLISLDGDSHKRQMHCYSAALVSLKKMRESVKDEFQERIAPYIKDLEEIGSTIARDRLTRPYLKRIKRDVARHKRGVEKRLSPTNVDTWLKEKRPHYEY